MEKCSGLGPNGPMTVHGDLSTHHPIALMLNFFHTNKCIMARFFWCFISHSSLELLKMKFILFMLRGMCLDI